MVIFIKKLFQSKIILVIILLIIILLPGGSFFMLPDLITSELFHDKLVAEYFCDNGITLQIVQRQENKYRGAHDFQIVGDWYFTKNRFLSVIHDNVELERVKIAESTVFLHDVLHDENYNLYDSRFTISPADSIGVGGMYRKAYINGRPEEVFSRPSQFGFVFSSTTMNDDQFDLVAHCIFDHELGIETIMTHSYFASDSSRDPGSHQPRLSYVAHKEATKSIADIVVKNPLASQVFVCDEDYVLHVNPYSGVSQDVDMSYSQAEYLTQYGSSTAFYRTYATIDTRGNLFEPLQDSLTWNTIWPAINIHSDQRKYNPNRHPFSVESCRNSNGVTFEDFFSEVQERVVSI
jgi:hypothetical protein